MNLRGHEKPPPIGQVVTYPAVVVTDSTGALAVNVNGNIVAARWQDPLVVAAGDPVTVAITAGPTGGGEAVVTGRITAKPRPAEGTVTTVPPSSPTITVTGSDGIAYTAKFVGSYTPTVTDNVILAWNANVPTVTGKVGASASTGTPSTGVAPPPGPSSSGQDTYTAFDSATWVPGLGAWDRWARQGGRVYQGSASGHTTYGAWFYAGSLTQLAGRTLNRIQFTLGTRLGDVGAYNDPITLHLYAHTSPTRPGGDVTRVTGPHDVVIQPRAGQQTFDLPLTFAAALVGGGGIAIAGEPYAGFNGCQIEPASGLLTTDWSR